MRSVPGASVKLTRNCAKSTCACRPGGVSNRRSKPPRRPRADGAQEVFDPGIATRTAEVADFPIEPATSQVRVGGLPLPQISLIRGNLGRPGWARLVDWRVSGAVAVFLPGVWVAGGGPRQVGGGGGLLVGVPGQWGVPHTK